ncbi:adenylate cyclase [Rivularia sp. IAM M-261]|nr:adenylate cyclase [Rivularia sp. IAM M-261]
MSKLVFLKMDGNLEQGFQVTLEIGEDNARSYIEASGSLPSYPDLSNSLIQWQSKYNSLVNNSSRIKPKEIIYCGSINRRINECKQLESTIHNYFQSWLNCQEFRSINNTLREELNRDDIIRVLIRTNDEQLQQIPWHLWDFFQTYSQAEFALSTITFHKTEKSLPKPKIRILAILGNSTGIDVQKDRDFLESLPNSEITFLVEPLLKDLNNQLWEHQWDILFFAGHSETHVDTGRIYINQTDSLTINELSNALKTSIAQGLQLAIFNSCDGLGLARQLAKLNIPQIIVMRQPVPDKVAQEFLKNFLEAFSNGKSLYLASREAREKLQGLEDKYPSATWLPVIFQNPAVIPLTWNSLLIAKSGTSVPKRHKRSLTKLLATSLVVTMSIIGARFGGMLQSGELHLFDQIMQSRPREGADNRLLIIGIREEDFQLPEQKDRKGSLSDLALARLIEKLEQHKPRAIGLDIFRDFPVDSKQVSLKNYLQKNDKLFAICQVGEPEGTRGISQPPEMPIEHLGFSNIIPDSDGVIRRHLLSMDVPSTSLCQTPISFSLQLASRYLKEENITPKITQGNWQLGNVVFHRLQSPTGAYQKADTWGNQILLNYRSYHSPLQIADIVTLKDILTNKVKPDIKNRIILIGVMTRTSGDQFSTPYSVNQSTYQEMPGVILHAQMISQILSAVLDRRPLIQTWSFWGDFLWIWGWSITGGVIVWYFSAPLHRIVVGGITIITLYGLCYWLLIQGNWAPLVPSAIALISVGCVQAITNYKSNIPLKS